MASRALILDDCVETAGSPDQSWPGDLWRDRLATLAAGLDERYVRGGALLGQAVETIRDLIDGLDASTGALDREAASAAITQLHAAAMRIADLPAMLRARDGSLAEIAGGVGRLEAHMLDLQRQLQMLAIYGMNIKIAGAAGDFRIFVDDMADRLQTGTGEIAAFIRDLGAIRHSVVPVRKAYAEVLSTQGRHADDAHDRIRQCADRLGAYLDSSASAATQLGELAGAVAHEVNAVLSAIQIADSTRQRIEHVVTAIDRAEAAGMAGDACAALFAALIDGAARDHAETGRMLTTSLAQLASAGDDLAQLTARSTGGDGGTTTMRDLESGIGSIAAMTARLDETVLHANSMFASIADAADHLTTRLDAIDQIVRDVKEIAINTRLLCLRQGQTGIAVAVIAIEVATQAARLKETAAAVGEEIAGLNRLNAGLRDDVGNGGDDLGAMLDTARTVMDCACRDSDAALTRGADQARALMTKLDQASAALDDESRLTEVMAPAAKAFARDPGPLDMARLGSILGEIRALYTMAAERNVHDALFGTGATEAPAAVEQDEDGLF
jgi:hypothetical protein